LPPTGTTTTAQATPPAPTAQTQVPGKTVLGQAAEPQPDGQVSLEPVRPTNIFIQAGAFTRQSNAQLLTTKLSRFGPVRTTPIYVNNQLFYRVRVGPIANVTQADQVLQQVIQSGQTEARIVVD
jgi:rare lipoprotein A